MNTNHNSNIINEEEEEEEGIEILINDGDTLDKADLRQLIVGDPPLKELLDK